MSSQIEHKMWLLDSDGSFSGAIVDMAAPIVSNKQWQNFLNDLLKELEQSVVDPDSIDGSYTISFNQLGDANSYAGMIFSKINGKSFEDSMTIINFPSGTLGLMHIFSDDVYRKVAILSLMAGDFSDKGDFTPNRILGAAFFGDKVSAVRKNNVSPIIHDRVLDVGKVMLNNLDSNLILQGYNS